MHLMRNFTVLQQRSGLTILMTPCPASPQKRRGWTPSQVDNAIRSGNKFPAASNLNPNNGATRFVNSQTGRSVVIDNKTGQLIHVGGDGFKY
jgi:hypothetical protein